MFKSDGENPTPLISAGPMAGSDERARDRSERASTPLRVAVVGVPNCGKSLLFHRLSGRFSASSNCPYTTARLEACRTSLGGQKVVLIDTPGLSGLEFCSEDEAPTRDLLQNDPPDVIILCMDAANLLPSLVLAAQLADLEIPMVVSLNRADEALARGIFIDTEVLGRELGVPVLTTCALDGRGIPRLSDSIGEASRCQQVRYPRWIQNKLDGMTPVASRAQRVDRFLANGHQDLQPGQSIWHMVLEAHHHWARGVAERVSRATGLEPERSLWDTLEHLALHPLGSWIFLLVTMAAVYLLVAKVGVGLLADGMERLLVQPILAGIAAWTGPGLLSEVLVGQFGLLSLGLFNALCTVLPILGVFYLVFGFLEDVGYFPLLSVQFDRLLRTIGLTGRAVLPITLGFGCNSVATLSTRCLPTPRQRFIACFMIALGIPCAVQLGVMVAILSTVPVLAILGLMGIVVTLMVVVGSSLARLLPKREQGEFLLELPPLRPPRWPNILSRTYHRLGEFLTEAVPLFVASASVLLTLHLTGLLERIRDLFAPVVVRGMGLPREATDMLLMTLARREVGAVMMKEMVDGGRVDLRQIFIGLLVMTLFVPCMSNTLILGRTVGWLRTAVIFIAVTVIAIGAGFAVNTLWP